MKIKNNKKGQVTIFIILAIVIIAVLAFLFIPRLNEFIVPVSPGDLVPKSCVEKAVRESLNLSMEHGGKANPELFFRYNNQSINYLCYTSQWYKTCLMQMPLVKQAIESDVQTLSQQKIASCINNMLSQLNSRGYQTQIKGTKTAIVSIIPGSIIVDFNFTLTLTKADQTQTLLPARFRTEFSSASYDIIMIASSILNFEARFGDSYPESFMSFYPNMKIEKKKQDDGSKVYILQDTDTNERLLFATRSLAWPPGLAVPGVTI
jgi:hypothetical protein